jgi:hypothetical protein
MAGGDGCGRGWDEIVGDREVAGKISVKSGVHGRAGRGGGVLGGLGSWRNGGLPA